MKRLPTTSSARGSCEIRTGSYLARDSSWKAQARAVVLCRGIVKILRLQRARFANIFFVTRRAAHVTKLKRGGREEYHASKASRPEISSHKQATMEAKEDRWGRDVGKTRAKGPLSLSGGNLVDPY